MFPDTARTTSHGVRHRHRTLGRVLAGIALALAIVLTQGIAHAEGSRTLFPLGYLPAEGGPAGATISNLRYGTDTDIYLGTLRQRNFLYVYARAGEYILLGTSGSRNAMRLYARPSAGQSLRDRFGVPGLEDHSTLGANLALSGSNCGDASANITTRTIELAGPRNIDNNANLSGYVPCYYQVPVGGDGIYGVVLTTATNTNILRWDITVRGSTASTTDIHGRVFTYAFSGDTTAATNRTFTTHYYVTDDGYRYSQTMRGLAPFRYVLYSNPRGFLDVDGNPLYKDVRGQGQTLNTQTLGSYFRPSGTGIQTEEPTYPMFFSNVVAAGVDTADGLQATLGALGIPLAPAHPIAHAASFRHAQTGGTTTYVGQGGIFTISTENALTYQILLKAGSTPAHDDPAHPENRVLTGVATGLNQQVYWDGLDNSGNPMPAGSGYTFEATGRAGEVHFPFLDAEANLNGGPTVTRLNGVGSGDSTVYYDDRGYTTNGVNVGTPGGHLCGGTAGAANEQPTPNYSLTGVDSSNANFGGAGLYYRRWGSVHTGNNGNDCEANAYFGDAKGMDMWALIKSSLPPGALSLIIVDISDVTATASVPASVSPGGTAVIAANFGNVGSLTAANVSYSAQLPAGLGGVSCGGANCSYNAASGLVTISGLPTSLSAGQWTGPVTLQYTAPASGSVPASVTVTTSSAQPVSPAPQAPDTASGSTAVAAGGAVADVSAELAAPLTAAPAAAVHVTATFRNLGPLSAANVAYTLALPGDLTGVSCSAPASCTYNTSTGAIVVTGLPATLGAGASATTTLSYTAPSAGTVPVTAGISTTTAETTTADNTVTALTIISSAAITDVTASVAPPAQAIGNTAVTVPVTFRNLGPRTAAGMTYALTLPPGLGASVTCSAPVTCNYNNANGALTLTSGAPATLQTGQVLAFNVGYTAPPTGTVTFSASVGTSTTESNTDNNSVSAQTTLITGVYTVTFESNGGSAVGSLTNVAHGSVITAPTPPTRTGYGFTGWHHDAGLVTPWNFGTDTVTAAVTLYAGWQINVYTLSYTAGANGSITGSTTQMVSHGGNGSAVTAAPNAGYHFVSWSDGLTTDTRTALGVTGNLAVTASFAINSYTLTYTAGANGSITGTSPQTVNHGANGSAVSAVPNAGYHFVSWSDGLTTATRTDLAATGNLTLTASFAINSYTLTYAAGANGSITGTSPQTVNHGGNGSAVTAVPDAGYHFVSWSDGVTTASRTALNVTANLTVTASFAAADYTVSYSVSAQGTLIGDASQSVPHGGNATAVTAVPNAGYDFYRWSDGVLTATRNDGNVTGNISVVANFSHVQTHTLQLGQEQDFNRPDNATLSQLRRLRGGVQTSVNNPDPADYVDILACNGTACRFLGHHSGRYELIFIGASGDAEIVVFTIHPNVGFATARQPGSEGMPVRVSIVLDDLPVTTQIGLNYSVQNGAAVGSPDPADLLTRDPQTLLLDLGTGGNLNCLASGRCHADILFTPSASTGDIRFALQASDGARLGDYPAHVVQLVAATLAPLTADLLLLPGHTVIAGTPVNAEVTGLPPGNYSFNWTGSDSTTGIGAQTGGLVTPSSTSPGNYLLRVTVRDLDQVNRAPIDLQTWLRVIPAGDPGNVCGPGGCADDGNSIPLVQQAAECGLTEDDPAGTLPYRLQVGTRNWSWNTTGLCLETLPGYGLRLGTAALLSAPAYGAGIERAAVNLYGNGGRQVLNPADSTHDHQGIYYDFEVTGLDAGGQSAAIAIPLPRNLVIPAGAVWRKYHAVDGWSTFVTDARNTVHSARRGGEQCPSPVSGVWNENPGLVAGLNCVRLVIEDGGRNDMDRQANGVIVDPGVLAVAAEPQRTTITVTSSGRKGGGTMSPLTLLAIGMLALLRLGRVRRFLRVLLPAALAALAGPAGAGDVVRTPGWFAGATAGLAMGEVDGGDVTRGLAELGIDGTARVANSNRFAWRAFGGYQFDQHWSAELGYTNLGKATTYIESEPLSLDDIPGVLPASGAGWELSVSGYLPINARFDLYGRIGAWRWETLYHLRETGERRQPEADGADLLGGLGVRYRHDDRWEAGLGWDHYRVDSQSVNLLGLSVIYRWGHR